MDNRDSTHLLAWLSALEHLTYYEILAVDQTVTRSRLARAFHAFAMTFHPDAHQSASAHEREALSDVFQHGAEAYRVLSNPELRTRYDMALRAGDLRLDQGTISLPPARPDWAARLDERCRSAGAKLHAVRAQKLFRSGDVLGAKAALEDALTYDGGANLELQRYIEDLELRRPETEPESC